MVKNVFKEIEEVFATGFVLLCVFVPLGLWKLVDIVIWLFQHVKINIL
jgi:hypothetical protein